jgi:hypothetical protein
MLQDHSFVFVSCDMFFSACDELSNMYMNVEGLKVIWNA